MAGPLITWQNLKYMQSVGTSAHADCGIQLTLLYLAF